MPFVVNVRIIVGLCTLIEFILNFRLLFLRYIILSSYGCNDTQAKKKCCVIRTNFV